jgi:hypothetical protein
MKIYLTSSIFLTALCIPANADTLLSRDKALSVIQARKSELFKDPSSLRDAAATGTKRGSEGGTLICVRANARNELGGYGGIKNYLVWIDSGKPYIVEATDPKSQCPGAFLPAPRLNRR